MHRGGDTTASLGDGDSTVEPAALSRGASFGRYVILERVGAGGVGEVYAAYDPHLDRRVALKLLRPRDDAHGSTDPQTRPASRKRQWQRTLREAQALAKLNHPNVVTVHDVGEHDGRTYLAMELVDGEDLATRLARAPKLGWREALRLMLAAGRGLAAAHSKSTIHRDFKPANVLVGRDGRVRVTDFGLARLLDPTRSSEANAPDATGVSNEVLASGSRSEFTRQGQIAGTPLYMAPEQHVGDHCDERSDVYAYCVALYEAVYAHHPFQAPTMSAIAARKLDGPPAPPPDAARVPAWLRAAIARGLAPKSSDRWPRMEELIKELEHRIDRRRRAPILALAATMAAVGVAVVYGGVAQGESESCEGGARHLVGVWDDDVETLAASAFGATQLPYAPQAWIATREVLATYAEDWAAAHRTTCEASRFGEQSERLLDERMGCLRQRLVQFQALTSVFLQADATTVERAFAATARLEPPQSCLERGAGGAQPPLQDPAVAEQLARAVALHSAGRYREGLDAAERGLELARRDDDRHAVADAAHRVGVLEAKLEMTDGAIEHLEEALWTAHRLGYGSRQAAAATVLVHVVGVQAGRPDEGLRFARYAEAQLEREGADAQARSMLANNLGLVLQERGEYDDARVHFDRALDALGSAHALRRAGVMDNIGVSLRRDGRYEDAVAQHRRALEIREEVLGPDHPVVAKSLGNLAAAVTETGDVVEAERIHRRSIDLRERALGPTHPAVATGYNNLGGALYRAGRHAEAEAAFQKALEIREATLPPDHPKVASAIGNIGLALVERREYDAAIEKLRESLAIIERTVGPNHDSAATTRQNLANALMAKGEIDAAGVEYRRAIEILEAELGPEHPDVAISMTNLGNVLEAQGQFESARRHHQRALAIRERKLGPDHPDLIFSLGGIAGSYQAAGAAKPAIPPLERALTIAAKNPNNDPALAAAIEFELAQALWDSRTDRPRARTLAEKARKTFATIPTRAKTLETVQAWLRGK